MAGWVLEIDEVTDEGRVTFHFQDQLLFGAYSTSRRFLVGARSAEGDDGDSYRGGRVILLDTAERVQRFSACLTRPWDAHVSDEGLVVVEDWSGRTQPDGALVALSPTGRPLWEKRYRAAVDRSFMSRDGTLVLVSTCHSDHEPHSGKTWLVDSTTGDVLWEHDGWSQSRQLRFRGDHITIGRDGERLERWVLRETKDALHREDEDELDELLNMLQGVIVVPGVSNRDRALAWRYLGDIALQREDPRRAHECWTRALEVDPGVGVKRQLAAMARELAGL